MIEMIKNSTISFLLKMDVQGIKEILMYIKEISGKDGKCPRILHMGIERNLEIELTGDTDKMLIRGNVIKMYMQDEELSKSICTNKWQ